MDATESWYIHVNRTHQQYAQQRFEMAAFDSASRAFQLAALLTMMPLAKSTRT
jgi:hypothetical protein